MIKICGLLGLIIFSTGAIADTQQTSKDEIQHLLLFVETSDCTYERNGTDHSSAEAKVHIKKKHNYYEGKIKTAEDFVKYSATTSKMSGKYYFIKCPGSAKIRSKDWLLAELHNYRQIAH